MSTVKFKRGEQPPPLSDAERAALQEHGPATVDNIDYSDIPQLDHRFSKNAIPNPFYRPVKKQLSLRIDADVIAWLKEGGPGWQTRLNACLRREMVRERQAAREEAPQVETPQARIDQHVMTESINT